MMIRELTILVVAADLIPVISNVKAGYETVFAVDPITGRELEAWERALAGAGIIGRPLIKGSNMVVNLLRVGVIIEQLLIGDP
ncbi:pre-toxin TG domain-containing protein [Salipaludibacillus sp. HK11]|uniref:pre-toxin TG domain-containing protein n=1 Tax=Salipaludibacillus sp. HK11 TaxID=3394320 RepID=UPI0039FB9504